MTKTSERRKTTLAPLHADALKGAYRMLAEGRPTLEVLIWLHIQYSKIPTETA